MVTRSVAELLGAATTILALGSIFQTCLIDSTRVTVFPVLDMYVFTKRGLIFILVKNKLVKF